MLSKELYWKGESKRLLNTVQYRSRCINQSNCTRTGMKIFGNLPSEKAMPRETPNPVMARTSSILAAAMTSVGIPLSRP